MVQAPSRRDRIRVATTAEIKQTARRILVQRGLEAASLRAIAREMGMTAPALYRYFCSHDDLLRHILADIFTELTADLELAIEAAAAGQVADRLVAACRQFRRWSLDHRAEFGLLFGSPLPSLKGIMDDEFVGACAMKFGGIFWALFVEMWQYQPVPVPADADVDPGLRGQLERYRDGVGIGGDLPAGAMLLFLRCWVRLYGAVCLEVFGHLQFALDDPAPMFEITLTELAGMLCLSYPPG